jgi:hypothetical protein
MGHNMIVSWLWEGVLSRLHAQDTTAKLGIKNKRLQAAWDETYACLYRRAMSVVCRRPCQRQDLTPSVTTKVAFALTISAQAKS